ncbi:MAG TPA: L,D-transpeptidase, partial [Flavobacterium sp.]|nr:L,D-transpeptidase [Flavobacterium sp.]
MKIWYTPLIAVVFFAVFSCNSKADKKDENAVKKVEKIPELKLTIDTTRIAKFYESYPKLTKYKTDVTSLYQKNKSTQLWQDNKGVVEFGNTLFNQYKNLDQEGLKANYPYKEELNSVFENNPAKKLSKEDTDLLLSNLYYYYAEKVYAGFDEKTSISMEWLLPRKKFNYQVLSDSIFKKSTILDDKKKKMFSQYYKLRDALKEYREIEKNGGW